jgi:hypothetical protein
MTMMNITDKQFDTAMALLKTGGESPEQLQDVCARLIAAAGFVLRQRAGIPDDALVDWRLPMEELPAFFTGLSKRQRRLIREIAEELVQQKERIH